MIVGTFSCCRKRKTAGAGCKGNIRRWIWSSSVRTLLESTQHLEFRGKGWASQCDLCLDGIEGMLCKYTDGRRNQARVVTAGKGKSCCEGWWEPALNVWLLRSSVMRALDISWLW